MLLIDLLKTFEKLVDGLKIIYLFDGSLQRVVPADTLEVPYNMNFTIRQLNKEVDFFNYHPDTGIITIFLRSEVDLYGR